MFVASFLKGRNYLIVKLIQAIEDKILSATHVKVLHNLPKDLLIKLKLLSL